MLARAVPIALLVMTAAAVLPRPAIAWGGFGHEVVGYLAMHDLDESVRAAIAELLGEETLASTGSWPDQVRPDRPETAPLHYINGPTDQLMPRQADFELAQGNAWSAILGYAERLADSSLPHEQRAEALKFMVHFIGDLHQPLHAGFAHDRGGNDQPVIVDGELINLHRYWDRDILADRYRQYSAAEYAAILHARHSARQRAAWAADDDPRDWVIEARRYIFSGLYPPAQTDHGSDEFDGAIAVLDQSYRDVWLPVAERQLAKAGARAAATLNALFSDGQSPFEAPPIPFPPTPRN